ncbi:hypothetical protein B0T10DRAFT_594752 [Thelonectria olida]|uniref:Uncharacterized protein n=1 Tax=Thelonectria olida TaxID=1576542 RepID=A0A9P9AJN0_9HYPO|nr:hypothetical protein B0T10DRAFT_594752 [Thelonectria olida]
MSSSDHYLTQEVAKKLSDYQTRRTQRYTAVNVLLLAWEDDDIGAHLDAELNELDHTFRVEFNYSVQRYRIPSRNSELSLNACIAQFILVCGGEENLIIVYYSGHGGPKTSTKSPCTWAAKNVGEPTLDWSNIQPQLLIAPCDVVILLDCCYAGQAARNHVSRGVEFLAATDKDQWTPIGKKNFPSFTRVLLREMKDMITTDGYLTLPALQRRMVDEKAGLQRQPFYVSLTGDASAGPIKLARLSDTTIVADSGKSRDPTKSITLRLSLFDVLDSNTASRLLRWLTKDSPAAIQDVEFATSTLSFANDVKNLGQNLLGNDSSNHCRPLNVLGEDGQIAVHKLFDYLKTALADPLQDQPASTDIVAFIKGVQNASTNLVTFVTDSLTALYNSTYLPLYSLSVRELNVSLKNDTN